MVDMFSILSANKDFVLIFMQDNTLLLVSFISGFHELWAIACFHLLILDHHQTLLSPPWQPTLFHSHSSFSSCLIHIRYVASLPSPRITLSFGFLISHSDHWHHHHPMTILHTRVTEILNKTAGRQSYLSMHQVADK